MTLAEEIASATLPAGEMVNAADLKSVALTEHPGSNPGRANNKQENRTKEIATPEVSAILKAADLAEEPVDLRFKKIASVELEMPVYVYRHGTRKLTKQVMIEICNSIRAGATDYVAAEAAGITKQKFDYFLQRFSIFRDNVMQAHAQCRVQLEQDVAKKKPESWLLRGPAREKPGRPGWASQTTVTGPDGGAPQLEVTHKVDLKRLPEAELEKLRELVAKATETNEEIIDGEIVEEK